MSRNVSAMHQVRARDLPQPWDMLVPELVGPGFPCDPPGHRERMALALAVAALRFAGENDLAALVSQRSAEKS